MPKAAYIHIPFCEHICHYCDFNKVFLKGQPVDDYLCTLEQEMKLVLEKYPSGRLQSIFVGGGTPTALTAAQLKKLVKIIRNLLTFDQETEFTIEANPGDLSKEKLQILYDAGVNRLSLGVQTFQEQLLERIGRTHRADDVFHSLSLAKNIGFKNISIDLMYSLPGQTLADFKETLDIAFSLGTTHFSAYSLIVEPKTVFYNLMRKGKLITPSEDEEAEMYGLLLEQMEKHSYKQYEISNFARTGYESVHNLTYWNNDYYYGFGAGAHSYINGVRRANYGPLKKYMEPIKNGTLPIKEEHRVSRKEAMEEEMFLGLRKVTGVSFAAFKSRFKEELPAVFQNQVTELVKKQLLTVSNGSVQLTKKGRFLGNEVFQEFLLP
ncbi:oxygen-independent coproporphyrinogen III oxidase [Bacillaceae bacterium Marseille-Q3522]|nr:oxygen-independent coproporphyrinogen III oxidase [Bacillaceae bacterium Marseille-Q3522]